MSRRQFPQAIRMCLAALAVCVVCAPWAAAQEESPTLDEVTAEVTSEEVVPGDPFVVEPRLPEPVPINLQDYAPMPLPQHPEGRDPEPNARELIEASEWVSYDLITGEEKYGVGLPGVDPDRSATDDEFEFSPGGPFEEDVPFDEDSFEGLRDFSGFQLISNPESFPWRINCKLFFSQGSGNYVCSGSLIDSKHAITAGHCIHQGSGGSWSTNVVVVPGYENGNFPFGSANGTGLLSWTGWTNSGSYDHDIGIIELDRPVGALTSWYGYGWSDSCSFFKDPTHHMSGYPAASPFNGQYQYYRFGDYDGCDTNIWGNWTGNEVRFNNRSYGGSSGTGSYKFVSGSIRAVFAILSNGTSSKTWCPRITQGKFGHIGDFFNAHRPTPVDLWALDTNATPTTVNAGAALSSFNYLVHNYSRTTWSGTVSVQVRLSTNDFISTGDTLIQTHNFNATISPLSSVRVFTSAPTIPATTPSGNYFLGVILSVSDHNSFNNATHGQDATPITVVCPTPALTSGLGATNGTQTNKIRVTWNHNASATGGYTLYRATSPIGTPIAIASTPAGTTYYDDASAIPGRDYCYWIRAYSACGLTGGLAGPACGWAGLTAPVFLCASDCTSTSRINLYFYPVWGASCYRIWRSVDGGAFAPLTGWCPPGIFHVCTPPCFIFDTTARGTGICGFPCGVCGMVYSDTSALPCHSYSYRIQAAPNDLTRASGLSIIRAGCVALQKPTGVDATDAVYVDRVRVSWSAVPNATHYRVHRNGIPISPWQTALFFDDFDSTRCTPYDSYTVEAACDADGSQPSGQSAADVGFPAIDQDCNTNGIPDECELCPTPVQEIRWGGIADGFAPPTEPTSPGAEIAAVCAASRPFDNTAADACLAHTFDNLPARILGAKLEIRLRASNTGAECNDTIGLQATGTVPSLAWSRRIGTGGTQVWCDGPDGLLPTSWAPGSNATLVLDLRTLPNADGTITNLIPVLNSDGRLDVFVSDDSGVDYVKLTLTTCAGGALPPNDCNTNGIPDDCDITAGTSMDGNANDYPDECEDTRLFCLPVSQDAIAGGTVEVDVFVEGVFELNSYQIRVLPNTVPANMMTLSNCYVDESRPDYVFYGVATSFAPFCNTGSSTIFSATLNPFSATADAPFGTPKYLGTFEYTVSPSAPASVTLELEIQPDPDSQLLAWPSGTFPYVIDPPCGMNFCAVPPPIAQGSGPRSLEVSLTPPTCDLDLAIRVESPTCGTLSKYVDAAGCLVSSPVYQTASAWGTVYVQGVEIVPEYMYTIIPENTAGADGPSTSAMTWTWCDVDDTGSVDISDKNRLQLCIACTINPSGTGCPGTTAGLEVLQQNAELDENPYACPGVCDMYDLQLMLKRLNFGCLFPHPKPCIGCDPVPSGACSTVDCPFRSAPAPDRGMEAVVTLAPLVSHAPAGGVFLVDAFVESVADLNGYQLRASITGGTAGDLGCQTVYVDPSRTDYVFYDVESLELANPPSCQVAAAAVGDGVPVGTERRYVGTFVLQASGDAEGDFLLDLTADDTSFLFDSTGSLLNIVVTPAQLSIDADPTFGDFDADGDVDLGDYEYFEACLAGPAFAVFPLCGVFDADIDFDVDLADFAEFQVYFTGSFSGPDTTRPVITCPPDETLDCTLGSDPSVTGLASATDDQDPNPAIGYEDESSGTCPKVITRTWTAEDSAMNTAACVQTITLIDNAPPALLCPLEPEISYDPGDCSVSVNLGAVSAIDNCDPAPIVEAQRSDGLPLEADWPVGQTVVTWMGTDVCGNPDSCTQVVEIPDCNGNAIADYCDTVSGFSMDCDTNGVPDECDPDCNGNGNADGCDIGFGVSLDCNSDGIPDECQRDCNGNAIPDDCELASGVAADCNVNGVPDECDLAAGTSIDGNGNGVPDACELADCDSNGVPDLCDLDCQAVVPPNAFGWPSGLCLSNYPGQCGAAADCNSNGRIDACEIAGGGEAGSNDCNGNGIPDHCDIAAGVEADCDDNGVPDQCELIGNDCNSNGAPDACDLAGNDCNVNGLPDECDIAAGTSQDGDGNGIPDECAPGRGSADARWMTPEFRSIPAELEALAGGLLTSGAAFPRPAGVLEQWIRYTGVSWRADGMTGRMKWRIFATERSPDARF